MQDASFPTRKTNASRRMFARVISIVTVVAAFAVIPSSGFLSQASAAPAGAFFRGDVDTSAENLFVSLTNQRRAGAGLPGLQVDSRLVGPSRNWAQAMADAGSISHRSNTRLKNEAPSEWLVIGENVGTGPEVQAIETAFENSPPHLRNILDGRFTHVGIGVVAQGNTLWVTVYFMQYESAPAPEPEPTPPAVQPETPAPASETPAVTSPPTTKAPRRVSVTTTTLPSQDAPEVTTSTTVATTTTIASPLPPAPPASFVAFNRGAKAATAFTMPQRRGGPRPAYLASHTSA